MWAIVVSVRGGDGGSNVTRSMGAGRGPGLGQGMRDLPRTETSGRATLRTVQGSAQAGTSGDRLGAGSAAVASRGGRKGPQAPEECGRGDAGKGSPALVDRPGALSPGSRGRGSRRSCVARGKADGGSPA